MAERLPEIELEETQELKENAENKNTKRKGKKHKTLFLRGRHALYESKSTGSDY